MTRAISVRSSSIASTAAAFLTQPRRAIAGGIGAASLMGLAQRARGRR